MNATHELMRLDGAKSIVPFGSGEHHQFSHTDLQWVGDPTGISIEEGEFLYGLVRMIQPVSVVETGTNYGCSASYICLAMSHNQRGHLVTIEHDKTVVKVANDKLSSMGFKNFSIHSGKVSEHQDLMEQYGDSTPTERVDFLWLDSEPDQRLGELVRFFPFMAPGAVACIHDCWDLYWEGLGGIPEKFKELIRSGDLRAMTFNTPHGVSAFQKRRKVDYIAELFNSEEKK